MYLILHIFFDHVQLGPIFDWPQTEILSFVCLDLDTNLCLSTLVILCDLALCLLLCLLLCLTGSHHLSVTLSALLVRYYVMSQGTRETQELSPIWQISS
jgi:hypothetical protein